jgi:phospholipid/cholesterol/gamma-HCH transport system permease protein
VRQDEQGRAKVELSGFWNLRALEGRAEQLETRLAGVGEGAAWDLTQVDALDHAGALLLWHAWGRRMADPLAVRQEHEALFSRLDVVAPVPPAQRVYARGLRPLIGLGDAVLAFGTHLLEATTLLGRVVLDVAHLVRRPDHVPWKEISANVFRTGTQALGITALVGFLVGVVLSYLTAQQLRTYGAEAYIVNLLGVAIVRELGPVLAAILLAGRSGSAMTAQIGVMRVTEELDALSVMGIAHTVRLVLPRMLALGISMPLLILWTNAIALTGGMASAQLQLGLDFRHFISSLPAAVPIANLYLGLGKGIVFGMLIALVACHFGLRIKPNTESLGTGTTNSVVSSITVVIVVDAIFAIMFSDVGSFL